MPTTQSTATSSGAYRQIRKRFKSGEIYLDDSLQHRHFSSELVSMDEKADALAQIK